jgi:hypothetical protein
MVQLNHKIIFIISMILMLLFISIIIYYSFKIETELYIDIPIVSFPFKNLFDENQKPLNIIVISAPFRETKHEELYEEYKNQGLSFCGISSYLEFPGPIDNPFEDQFHLERNHNYTQMASAWLHCFREDKIPDNLRQSNIPMILMTEADLKDSDNIPFKINTEKEYDFMYCCLSDNEKCDPGWQSYNRNWELAKKCLEVMCSQFNLKGVLVGRQNCEFTNKCNSLVKVLPFLPYNEFQEEMQKCKFLFVPNISDASPRVMTEAMCYNMPVLVNYNIIGGWHNVIPDITGEFFTDENDIIPSLTKIVNNYDSYQPRTWFQSNRGIKNSGKVLADFLKKCYPNLNNKEMKYTTITI